MLAPGSPANLTLFDPDRPWRVDPSRFESLSRNTPFAGWDLTGTPAVTIVEGRVVWKRET
jgi:dihydroorotase